MKKVVNILKKITDIILVCLIIILALVTINNHLNKENVTKVGNYYVFYVASGSMEPTLNVGDVIISKRTNNYEVGDIITYRKDNNYITHRIIEVNDDEITTKGDNNQTNDNPITKDLIKCEYYKKSKILTILYSCVKDPIIIIIIVFIIICINLIDYLCNERKGSKNEKENR